MGKVWDGKGQAGGAAGRGRDSSCEQRGRDIRRVVITVAVVAE